MTEKDADESGGSESNNHITGHTPKHSMDLREVVKSGFNFGAFITTSDSSPITCSHLFHC